MGDEYANGTEQISTANIRAAVIFADDHRFLFQSLYRLEILLG